MEFAIMFLRVSLWISVVKIPVLIILGAPLAFAEYGWITLPIIALVAYELLITLHENLAELGLTRFDGQG
jgi:hypothetical protein